MKKYSEKEIRREFFGTDPIHGWNHDCDVLALRGVIQEHEAIAALNGRSEDQAIIADLAYRARALAVHPDTCAKLVLEIHQSGVYTESALRIAFRRAYAVVQFPPPGARSQYVPTAEEDFEGEDETDAIEFDMLQLPGMLDHVRNSFRIAMIPMFRMEDRMVHTFRFEEDSDPDEKLNRPAGALVIEDVGVVRLLDYMISHAHFFKRERNGDVQPYAPPMRLAAHYLAGKDHWKLRALSGLIQAPTLRADGSLLTAPGYDKATGLYLDTNNVEYPAIKDRPTKADALAALKQLKTPFKDFPFIEGDDFECPSLSVALSAVLTGLIRRTLPAAPLHGFDAPTAGTGKTLVCNVVSVIVTGQRATVITFGKNDEEFKKLLFSSFLANDQIIQIDNITRPLEGESLNSALTETTLRDRILGESRNATVPTNALIMATGNNLKVKGDMVRRIVSCRMDAGERPEERSFDVTDLLAEVAANRPKLVAAGLTILRAFEVAGRPGVADLVRFGSFEDWTRRVRGALVWLGEADPCKTRESVRDDEPEIQELGDLLRSIHECSMDWFTADALLKKTGELREAELNRDRDADEFEEADAAPGAALPNAVDSITPKHDRKQLGNYLSANRERVIDGLRLHGVKDKHRRIWEYRVLEE